MPNRFGIPELVVSIAALAGSTIMASTGVIEGSGATNIYVLVLGYVFGAVTHRKDS